MEAVAEVEAAAAEAAAVVAAVAVVEEGKLERRLKEELKKIKEKGEKIKV